MVVHDNTSSLPQVNTDPRYTTFLQSKQLSDIPTGIDVDIDAISPVLFDWQKSLTRWALGRGRAALFAGTGLGKTLMQLAWAQHVPGRTLILAPLGVAHQTVSEAHDKLGLGVQYVRRPADMTEQVCITNYDLLEHFCGIDIQGIVLDECFPAGTLIETPQGRRRIEDMQAGDPVYSAAGIDTVVATKHKEISTLVEIHLSNGSTIWCSENHPFFSQDGIILGSSLKKGDALYALCQDMSSMPKEFFCADMGSDVLFSDMLQGFSPRAWTNATGIDMRMVPVSIDATEQQKTFLQSILLGKMAHESACYLCEGPQPIDGCKTRGVLAQFLRRRIGQSACDDRTHQDIKSYGRSSSACQDFCDVEGHASQAFPAGGQWQRINAPTTDDGRTARRGMVSRICDFFREAHCGLSHALQSRSWQSLLYACRRNRWFQSCFQTRARQKERVEAAFVRVERATIHQQDSPGFRARSDGNDTITCYDLQVAKHPSYSTGGVLVHNSSCLKGITSARRKLLFDHFTHIPFRLCCTATPAPNDIAEMAMHAEFLGVMTRTAMLATFFVHDDLGWRLMEHARGPFYRWLASWAMALRNPADLGYDGSAFVLPPLILKEHFLAWDGARLLADGDGQLGIAGTQKLHGIGDRMAVRQQTIALRAEHTARLVRQSIGPVVVWCGLVEEGAAIKRLLADEDMYEVKGSDSPQWKQDKLMGFARGEFRVLLTKGSIAGWGLNLQVAHTSIVCGMNDSMEMFYQLVRRLWRYGQTHPVTTHIVLSEHERPIWDNVQRKEREATQMIDGLIEEVKSHEQAALRGQAVSTTDSGIAAYAEEGWRLLHGDCVEGLAHVDDASVHLTVYSPPFGNLFQYHDSPRDIGNCLTEAQFFTHHGYVADHLRRVMIPGRLVVMHLSQIPAMLVRDGWIGLKDFRGKMVHHMVERGWIYAGEVTCGKSPQAQAIRIRAKGLSFNQLHKDAAWSRPCLGDYLVLFRAPGENPIPVIPDIDNNTWILWASNIWYSTYYDHAHGYRETATLNVAEGRDERDTKHICPLPLDLVERCIRLWSNAGEHILDPFSGLGTVGVKAIEYHRRYTGCELKDSYAAAQRKNLNRATQAQTQLGLL